MYSDISGKKKKNLLIQQITLPSLQAAEYTASLPLLRLIIIYSLLMQCKKTLDFH